MLQRPSPLVQERRAELRQRVLGRQNGDEWLLMRRESRPQPRAELLKRTVPLVHVHDCPVLRVNSAIVDDVCPAFLVTYARPPDNLHVSSEDSARIVSRVVG